MITTLLLMGASAVLGAFITFIYDSIHERLRFRRELRDNNNIDISGRWYAAWQTSVDSKALLNTETLRLVQKGKIVWINNVAKSPENPRGGYLWKARMEFYQGKYLMGWYFPLKTENISSKGIMFSSYLSQQRTFYGKWVGTAYDGDLACGFFVISSTRDRSLSELQRIIAQHKEPVNIISHTFSDVT